MKLYIVLPAYNEEEGLPALLTEMNKVLSDGGQDFQILVVNDGSKDQTAEVARGLSEKMPVEVFDNEKNMGLARTIHRGLGLALTKASDEDVIVTMDADNTHPPEQILQMLEHVREGSDVVIASRYRRGAEIHGLTLFRKFLSFGAAMLFGLVLPIKGVRDFTCGYRLYRAAPFRRVFDRLGEEFIQEQGFSCMAEILLNLRHEKVKFSEIPLILRYDQKLGDSKMNVSRTVMQTLKLLMRHRLGVRLSKTVKTLC